MNFRSMFKKIFKTDKINVFGNRLEFLNGYQPVFTTFNGNIYNNTTVRSCIDAIARNGAKLSPKHIRKGNNQLQNLNDNINRIISEQPNELMNAYDFYYKIISQLYLYNNVFIYVMQNEKNELIALYPIKANQYTLIEYQDEIYVKFQFGTGKSKTVAYKDLIHLKRMFCDDDVMGGNTDPIFKTLSFQHILKEGIINAIKTTQGIKGVIKSGKSMLKPEDVKKMRDQFVKDFVSDDNNSGIAGLDATMDFKEVNINPQTATDQQTSNVDKEIKDYYGVNDAIIQSKYSEDDWNAFYESVLEPLGIMMGLEFTNKIFSLTERYHGNKIIFEANRLQYASNKTKIEVARYMNNYLTINEIREIFNLGPLPNGEGDKVMQDLNHISDKIADSYQGGDNNE